MVQSSGHPASRYRRRILGLGALATGALYVIGAPIFTSRIEDDLERRVPAELSEAGFVGITASFSGQDGTLDCSEPLDDPEAARAAAFDVRGVRDIELDRSCRVNAAADTPVDTVPADPPAADDDVVDAAESADAAVSADASDEQIDSTTPPTEPEPATADQDLATVRDVVAANPDLAFLSVLLDAADIGLTDDAVTIFAPNNAAFDAVPADVLGRLQNDAALLEQVLSHHVVDGALSASDLQSGELVAHDGTALNIEAGEALTVDGLPLISTDIVASNGVVHVIGGLLLPPDIELAPDPVRAPASFVFDGTTITLTGVVASEVERQVVVEAAVAATGLDAVIDQMTVDPDTGLDAATAGQLAGLLPAMPGNLLTGEVGFDGTDVFATGVAATDDGNAAFVTAASAAGIEASVTAPPEATDEDAGELEAQLNAFVAENPILFEPSSAVLTDDAFAVIDRLAQDAQQFTGITITVEGHTDSDGVAAENLALSQGRADAVRAALIERGLSESAVEAVGFGSEQLVLVDGAEDKAASRRVEFRVVTAT